MIDDTQGMPPVAAAPAASLSTEDLAAELGSRMRAFAILFMSKLVSARKTDWVAVAKQLLDLEPDDPLPRKLASAVSLAAQLDVVEDEIKRYSPHALIGDNPPKEIGTSPDDEFSLIELFLEVMRTHSFPGFVEAQALSSLWRSAREMEARPVYGSGRGNEESRAG